MIWHRITTKSIAAIGITTSLLLHRTNKDLCYAEAPKPWGVVWNKNWDGRDPVTLANASPIPGKRKCEEVDTKIPIGMRHIFLIRHGQHDKCGSQGLSDLGKLQAKLTCERLNEWAFPYHAKVRTSNSARSMETANIFVENAKPTIGRRRQVVSDDLLSGGAAIEPSPPLKRWFSEPSENVVLPEVNEHLPNVHEDGPRLEEAFRKYFSRIDYKDRRSSYEVIVCHANVIRYFVCRALQFPPEAWLRFSLPNCSITWLIVSPNGHVRVVKIGECGHIPSRNVTYI